MSDINLHKSIEKKLVAVIAFDYDGSFLNDPESLLNRTSYQLGYAESMLTSVLRKIEDEFGKDKMLDYMYSLGIQPVHYNKENSF